MIEEIFSALRSPKVTEITRASQKVGKLMLKNGTRVSVNMQKFGSAPRPKETVRIPPPPRAPTRRKVPYWE